ncbi:hypothetical protein [Bradyrhizobium ottawaense]|nr:hypothetical protein [Bradyrhizobium ottawaense]
MTKPNRQKGRPTRALFDPEIAARWEEILRLREQIKKTIAKRKKNIQLLH